MKNVCIAEQLMVHRLRLGEGQSTNKNIYKKLNHAFQRGQPEDSSVHNIKCRVNSFNYLYSLTSSILSTRSTILSEPKKERNSSRL